MTQMMALPSCASDFKMETHWKHVKLSNPLCMHTQIRKKFVFKHDPHVEMVCQVAYLVGSSKNIICGLLISSKEIAKRFFSPPDRLPALVSTQ